MENLKFVRHKPQQICFFFHYLKQAANSLNNLLQRRHEFKTRVPHTADLISQYWI